MRLSLPILLCLINYCVCDNAVQEKISTAKKITEDILKSIHERWQVNSFPNFLRSAAISRTSWEVLKVFGMKHIPFYLSLA